MGATLDRNSQKTPTCPGDFLLDPMFIDQVNKLGERHGTEF